MLRRRRKSLKLTKEFGNRGEIIGMYSKVFHQKKSNGITIPICEISNGCLKIAENIEDLAISAQGLLGISAIENNLENLQDRRMAYIFVIHAIDEAGKLLIMIRKAINAEAKQESNIIMENFYSHPKKGEEAGFVGLQAIEWLEGLSQNSTQTESPQIKLLVQEYRKHLKKVRKNFGLLREEILYVDYNEEKQSWIVAEPPKWIMIWLDAQLLLLTTATIKASIRNGESFIDLSNKIQSIVKCTDLQEIIRKINSLTS